MNVMRLYSPSLVLALAAVLWALGVRGDGYALACMIALALALGLHCREERGHLRPGSRA